jgi:FkbM family methyltransferase
LARPLILSYAQNGEDVVLSRAFADQEFGFYVDIGACHPVEDSVTLRFYERGWHGVNVEPDQELYAAFTQARPRDANLCCAIGRTRGRIEFHPTDTRGHGTLDGALASGHSAGRPAVRVPTILLSDVIDCHGPDGGQIDFLKVDVEGWEAEVIASGDWARHRPRVLVIEAVDDKGEPTYEAWEPALLGAGYRFAMFDGLNRFYCRDEDAGLLLPRLGAPANVRDGWIRARDEQAHANRARLQTELAAAMRQAAEVEERCTALGTDLAEAHANERNARHRLEAVTIEAERSQTEMAAALVRSEESMAEAERVRAEGAARSDTLAVDAARARSEAALALHREDVAEARMAALEMDLVRREADDRVLRAALAHAEQQAHAEAARHASTLAHAEQQAQAAAARHAGALAHAEQQTDAAAAGLTAVYASTSWRMTRPLRSISLLLRVLRGRR